MTSREKRIGAWVTKFRRPPAPISSQTSQHFDLSGGGNNCTCGGLQRRRAAMRLAPFVFGLAAFMVQVVPGSPARAQAPVPAPQQPAAGAADAISPTATPQHPMPPGFAATTAADGQWPMPGRDTGLTRYSGLDQINAQNVRNLQVAFTFSLSSN